MKKNLLILLLSFFIVAPSNASSCSIECSSETIKVQPKGSFISRITGVNFFAKNIAEKAIQRELSKNIDGNIKADLDIFSLKSFKQGLFKKLTITSKQLRYKALSLSDVHIETICPVNEFKFENKKVYLHNDLPFKFSANITNEDLLNVVNSVQFQDELARSSLSFRGVNGVTFETPTVQIADNKIYFTLPITSFLLRKPYNIKFMADIEIKNNKIVLRNITFYSNRNIIGNDLLAPVIDAINPLSFQFNSINAKYCLVEIEEAKIVGDEIKTNGVLKIRKNYGR